MPLPVLYLFDHYLTPKRARSPTADQEARGKERERESERERERERERKLRR